ncbi:MAG: SMC-Scp complex subunit ScpB [Acidobacteria bacterium]|nr:SMC-Scp complex subunit ScpB [Acidobacteriota bacterium]
MTDRAELEAAIEAILFVTSEPLPRAKVVEIFGQRDRARAARALDAVLERYAEAPGRGVFAERVAGGVRLATRPELNSYLRKMFEVTGRNRLSMPALETLAIVAYRQPITAPEVQELRNVNSKGVLTTLLEHRLVRLAGRKQVVGKPFLYRTTRAFLVHFGLDNLEELPPLEEFEEMLGMDLGPGAVAPDVDPEEIARSEEE